MKVVSAAEAYRLWAPSFDQSSSPILALESRHVAPWLSDVRGKRVIDVGCGTGRWMKFLLERGARAFGADLSREMLGQASPTNLVQSAAQQLPFRDATADLVICALTIGHAQPVGETLAELARIARPGALVIVTDFHPDALRRGWKRTFAAGGQTCEIETAPYALSELTHADLEIEERIEPAFDEPERPLFNRAGKSELFEQVRGVAAIYAGRFRRRPA